MTIQYSPPFPNIFKLNHDRKPQFCNLSEIHSNIHNSDLLVAVGQDLTLFFYAVIVSPMRTRTSKHSNLTIRDETSISNRFKAKFLISCCETRISQVRQVVYRLF